MQYSFVIIEVYWFDGVVSQITVDFGFHDFDVYNLRSHSRQKVAFVFSEMPENYYTFLTSWVQVALLGFQAADLMDMPFQFLLNLCLTRFQEIVQNVYFASCVTHYQIQSVDFYWVDFELVSILVFEVQSGCVID